MKIRDISGGLRTYMHTRHPKQLKEQRTAKFGGEAQIFYSQFYYKSGKMFMGRRFINKMKGVKCVLDNLDEQEYFLFNETFLSMYMLTYNIVEERTQYSSNHETGQLTGSHLKIGTFTCFVSVIKMPTSRQLPNTTVSHNTPNTTRIELYQGTL